jgi:hypothetical protein
MRRLSKYELICRAIFDSKQIARKLASKPIEYYPQEVRSLNKEFEWTILCIIRMCNQILDEEPEDMYGEEIDQRIKVEKILYKYEEMHNKIYKK